MVPLEILLPKKPNFSADLPDDRIHLPSGSRMFRIGVSIDPSFQNERQNSPIAFHNALTILIS
jgi:hypothetical protein